MSWIVDILTPSDVQSDHRAVVLTGAAIVGALVVGGLVLTRQRPTESEAKARFIQSLKGSPAERERAKAEWERIRDANASAAPAELAALESWR